MRCLFLRKPGNLRPIWHWPKYETSCQADVLKKHWTTNFVSKVWNRRRSQLHNRGYYCTSVPANMFIFCSIKCVHTLATFVGYPVSPHGLHFLGSLTLKSRINDWVNLLLPFLLQLRPTAQLHSRELTLQPDQGHVWSWVPANCAVHYRKKKKNPPTLGDDLPVQTCTTCGQ